MLFDIYVISFKPRSKRINVRFLTTSSWTQVLPMLVRDWKVKLERFGHEKVLRFWWHSQPRDHLELVRRENKCRMRKRRSRGEWRWWKFLTVFLEFEFSWKKNVLTLFWNLNSDKSSEGLNTKYRNKFSENHKQLTIVLNLFTSSKEL